MKRRSTVIYAVLLGNAFTKDGIPALRDGATEPIPTLCSYCLVPVSLPLYGAVGGSELWLSHTSLLPGCRVVSSHQKPNHSALCALSGFN